MGIGAAASAPGGLPSRAPASTFVPAAQANAHNPFLATQNTHLPSHVSPVPGGTSLMPGSSVEVLEIPPGDEGVPSMPLGRAEEN